ncbi:DeoR/GlpR family DNA-binding transcription regulator [Liquorilactobacillus satsumensis]|uniref:DeoR family transcriptional regulator n=1 Tax=Liquorilactobacillus satsumensis DSM 16230 = JCM 12392 TaxID=1423801 RepID=A0A0R1V5T7_9LACO|nr:DeoR/GlpR family DNA-binding transcription regulator [Liquorilactobacillus satsumensis]KRL98466.1 DeoR family transcriptional regulator [Liquorilactobacillus satsumensis DSM 16230 = JCM 12392]MCC7666052.1 DeoR/GlpR transcriptional regulator [Liquorilactobacillus satsumensis]MCP9313046.1 DeoR/GlpR transcriptional regulator [Liquorilactobacillus satsumensis]MCP9328807.1 DeoR/GlpR transcriptional regulator [Liquorilactobacillus satsumensis]MCP9356843.1 DeoR/GlpR transcriptional regulator [Liqu
MLAEERQQMILAMLEEKGIVRLQDICESVECSESSARRDLQVLEEKGLLLRFHGGAKLKHSLQQELDMSGKFSKNTQQKSGIAKLAASLVQDGDVIYLDAGTSTLAMISFLHAGKNLVVVTNGVMHASALADQNIRTILVGGELKNTTKAIIGVETVKKLQQYRFDKVFLGMNGVHLQYGYTTPDPDEAAVKQTAIAQGERAYVLVDESKFDQISFVKVAEIADAAIITNKLPRQVLDQYSNQTNIQEVSI